MSASFSGFFSKKKLTPVFSSTIWLMDIRFHCTFKYWAGCLLDVSVVKFISLHYSNYTFLCISTSKYVQSSLVKIPKIDYYVVYEKCPALCPKISTWYWEKSSVLILGASAVRILAVFTYVFFSFHSLRIKFKLEISKYFNITVGHLASSATNSWFYVHFINQPCPALTKAVKIICIE
jgi:hypothetical protein